MTKIFRGTAARYWWLIHSAVVGGRRYPHPVRPYGLATAASLTVLDMPSHLPAPLLELAERQDGVVSRQQALEHGVSERIIETTVRSGRWQHLQRGIYSIYTGRPSRPTILWAAVLRAGPDAILSYQTAAEVAGLIDRRSSLIHVTTSAEHRVRPERFRDLVIHRSTRAAAARHPALLPPQTRIEETVLDLAAVAVDSEAAFGIVSAACQRRLTTPYHLREAMAARSRLRWRAELTEALIDVTEGVHSALEFRYVHGVEQLHRLPTGARQAKTVRDGRRLYLDNLYREYRLCVELDGSQAHPDYRRWDDVSRDNASAVEGLTTLRYGWHQVRYQPCRTAAQIAAVLAARGWPGPPRRCGPNCDVPSST